MAIAPVGGAKSNNSTVASDTIAYTISVGNTVVVCCTFNSTGRTVTSVTDNIGNSYSLQKRYDDGTEVNEIWSTAVGASVAGAATITLNFSNSTARNLQEVEEYSGVVALGLTAQNTGASGAPTISITTQDANNYVVASFGRKNTTTLAAFTTGTARQTQTAGSTGCGGMGDNTVASAGACAVTAATSADIWGAAALELRTSTGVATAKSRRSSGQRIGSRST